MKKACKYCGGIHERNYICDKYPKYKRNKQSDIFRGSYEWKLKREDIMKRDKYLCVACLHNLPGTARKLNNKELSVHHIQPLSSNYELRSEDSNLITLCRAHHEAAESGRISAQELKKLIK